MSAPTLTNNAVTRPRSAPELPASFTAARLKTGGVTPFSATDYPGKLAAVVFVQGCPWRCGYCHNPHLQTRTGTSPVAWIDVIALLKRRVGLIDAVVFSGGEPTMDPALADAMREVRALGFGVGLHTAGMYPRRLAEVLPLVDWVGIDIKAIPENYDAVTGISNSAQHIAACARLVLDSGLAHEFRSTIHPRLHPENEILALAQTLSAMGVRHYALQLFRSTGCAALNLNAMPTTGYPGADLLASVSALFSSFIFRQA